MQSNVIETFGTIDGEIEQNGFAVRTHDQLPEAEYHARPEWSKSQFALLPEEPELFWGRHIMHFPDWKLEETPQMRLGTAVHEAVLLQREVRVIPASVLTSNGQRRGKAWEEFQAEHAGETWLREAEAEPAKNAVDAVLKRKYARRLLEAPGESELSIFWIDELTGLRLRGRLDRRCHIGNGIILDLKTSNDPTPYGFPWKCLDLKYDVQAATYMDGHDQIYGPAESFVFIAVEVQPPYRCRIHEASEEFLSLGFSKFKESLIDLKDRLERDAWETTDAESVHTLRLPQKK